MKPAGAATMRSPPAAFRDRAEAFFLKVEPIRFRLITGHGLEAASQELRDAFAEFKVFGPTPWTDDPELDRLDPARRAADRGGERGLVPLGDGLGPARRSRTGAAGRGGL